VSIRVEPDWWKTLFDEVYLLTDARSVCDDEVTRVETDLLCEMLELDPDFRILDLCGGHGRHSMALYARGFRHCTLIDYSASLTERARRLAGERKINFPILCGDARDTGLEAEHFDRVIIMGNSLGYMEEPEADGAILAEARRVLKAGGRLLIDVVDGTALCERFTPRSWHEIGGDILVCRERELAGDRVSAREVVMSKRNGLVRDRTYSIRYYTPDSIARLMDTAGFEEVIVRTDFSPHQGEDDYGCMNNRMIAVGAKG
jgi:D-alanine-D-alanine ligase